MSSEFLADWLSNITFEFDIKSLIIELILLIPMTLFHATCLLKDLWLLSNKTILRVLKDTFEGVLQDSFQIEFQTFSLIEADFFDVGHFILFLLFYLRKLCTMLQFQLYEKRIFNSYGVVFLSPPQPKTLGELPPKSRYGTFKCFVT